MTPTLGSALSRRKLGVLGDLTESLKKIGIAKNKRKDLHDVATHKTRQFKIRESAEVEKKRLDVERELGNRRLALEERQQTFRKRMALNAQNHNSFLGPSHSDNHDTSVNWIFIEDKNNRLSGIGDEYFTLPPAGMYIPSFNI